MEEVSAGGIIVNKNNVCVLRKFRGEWVLPKGRQEAGESMEETALREVNEETGIKAEIVRYIGYVKYWYNHVDGIKVQKTVHYYYMKSQDTNLIPQREEGFTEAAYMPFDKAIHLVKHDAEKNMIRKTRDFFLKERKG